MHCPRVSFILFQPLTHLRWSPSSTILLKVLTPLVVGLHLFPPYALPSLTDYTIINYCPVVTSLVPPHTLCCFVCYSTKQTT